jgi:5-methylcytosine-specific restriction protein A
MLEQVERVRRERQALLKQRTLAQLRALATAGGQPEPGRRGITAGQYKRNEAVAEYVKRAARGHLWLCLQQAPFETADGPYLESDYVIHLSRGGPDCIDSVIALCPDCLLERIAQRDVSVCAANV